MTPSRSTPPWPSTGSTSIWASSPGRLPTEPVDGLTGSLHLHATDTDGEWYLGLAPDRLEHRREHAKADAALRGTASDLLLWLVGRRPADLTRASSCSATGRSSRRGAVVKF